MTRRPAYYVRSKRPLTTDEVRRLREVYVTFASEPRCAAALGTSITSLRDALTGGPLKPATIAKIMAAVDHL